MTTAHEALRAIPPLLRQPPVHPGIQPWPSGEGDASYDYLSPVLVLLNQPSIAFPPAPFAGLGLSHTTGPPSADAVREAIDARIEALGLDPNNTPWRRAVGMIQAKLPDDEHTVRFTNHHIEGFGRNLGRDFYFAPVDFDGSQRTSVSVRRMDELPGEIYVSIRGDDGDASEITLRGTRVTTLDFPPGLRRITILCTRPGLLYSLKVRQ